MDLAPLITAGGGLGAMAMVIVYLLGSNRSDRKESREELAEADARADAAEARERDLHARWDEEREARRLAQDQAAEALREVKGLREEVARLRGQLEQLTAALDTSGDQSAGS